MVLSRPIRSLGTVLAVLLLSCSSEPTVPDDAGSTLDANTSSDAGDGGDGGDGSWIDGTPPTVTGPAATVTTNEDTRIDVALTVGGVEAALTCADLLTATSSNPSLATFAFRGSQPDCTLEVIPALDASGTATITVTVTEGAATAEATFELEVTPVNDPPTVSFPDGGVYSVNEDDPSPPSFRFLVSDDGPIDCSDVVLSPTSQATALAASLTLAPGSMSGECLVSAAGLTPNLAGSGDVLLTVTDRDGLDETDGFTLRVLAVNDLPTITLSSSVLDFERDSADRAVFEFTVADTDGTAECSGTTATARGGAIPLVTLLDVAPIAAGPSACRLTIFFAAGLLGEGTIELVTTDNQGGSTTSSFVVRVHGVADAPEFVSAPADVFTFEDFAGSLATTFSVRDPDGYVDCSNVMAESSPLVSAMTLVDDGNGACVLSLTLVPNAHGDDPITLTLTDASGMTDTATFTLHVTSVIDQPLIVIDTTEIVLAEDGPDPVVPFTMIDVEHPGTTLDCQTAASAVVVFGTSGLVTGLVLEDGATAGSCLLRIELGANASGTATVRIEVTDASPRSRTAEVPIRVTPVPDAPRIVFAADPVTTNEDTPFFFYFEMADDDGGALPSCATNVTASGVGALIESLVVTATGVQNTCRLTVTPVANAFGSAPIAVTIVDAGGLQSTSSLTLVVNSVGDGLTLSSVPDQNTVEDVPVSFDVSVVGDGPIGCNAETLTSSVGTLTFSGTAADCRVTLTPPLNQSGTLPVTLRAFDGTLEALATFELTIAPLVDDMCLPVNGYGGCEQRCLASVDEVVTCGCFPGFTANGSSCDPVGPVTLLNEGLARFFDVSEAGAAPRQLGLRTGGRAVEMTQVGQEAFTFTVRESPGTCANGQTNASCVDSYRLCADANQVKVAWSSARSGTPSSWDSPLCAWVLSDLGSGRVRLKNLGLRETHPFFGFLACDQPGLCALTYDDSTVGNTVFRIDAEQCSTGAASCDANATCTHTPSGAACVCNAHFMGDGTTCVPLDACAIGNGGCAQRCVGTEPDDSAVCACAPGFDLAPDGVSCVPRAELRLFNTGLAQSLLLPPLPSLAFFAQPGSPVRMEPLAGSPGAFTFTVETQTAAHRLCVHQFGGFKAHGLTWTSPDPAPAEWSGAACGWFVDDAGNGEVHLRSLLLDGTGYGFLRCDNAFDCPFNLEGDTSGNTRFVIDQDECAAGTTGCDAHAVCADSVPGFTCACGPGYSGDGQSCVLTDVCAIGNGGCAQRCLGTAANGAAICGCFAGSVLGADGVSCDPVDGGRLYNVGLGEFFALRTAASMPFRFEFRTPGDDVTLRPASTGPSDWTLEVESTPGRCADGSTSAACPDRYRLCVVQAGGSRLGVALSNAYLGEPADWNDLECSWRIEPASGDSVRLKNVWLQTALPHIDFLDCASTQDCTFTLDESTAGNTEFVFDVDECAIGADRCDPNADCTNTLGSYTCACRTGFVANGDRCDLVDACVVDNGSCSQRCVGTQAGQGVCACFNGFTLGADGRSCEPAERIRILNDGVGYLDLDSNHFVSISPSGRSVAVDPVPGTHDRFTITMSEAPGYCADGSTNVFCPNLYRLCARNSGGMRVDPILRDARVGDPPEWNDPACTWIFEPVGADQVRIKNLWLQQDPSYAHLDYLVCGGPNICEFTLDESTAGNTLFTLDPDSCADGSAGCDANATCADTRDGAVCTCNAGYAGNGQQCVLEDVCVVRNGDCEQKCLGSVAGQSVCGCVPGFTLGADGRSCEARSSLRLFNIGQSEYLDSNGGVGPGALDLTAEGRTIRMEQTLDGPDTFTITVEVKPGTCPNGSTRDECPNLVRMCAGNESGFRWSSLLWSQYGSKPASWDSPECRWRVEDLGDGTVRLRSLWLQQHHPSLGNLRCTTDDCFFASGTDTSASARFAIYTDECSSSAPACDPHATCRNLGGVDTCVCQQDWSGDGITCQPDNPCVVDNGGCQQRCTASNDVAVCGCWQGFDSGPNGSCVPWPDVRLVSAALGSKVGWTAANGLRFDATGLPLNLETSPLSANAVTLTLEAPLGDQVRICGTSGSTGWVAVPRAFGSPEPAAWSSVECAWIVEGEPSGGVRLRNLGIEQDLPQFDYLECWNSAACGFTYLNEKTPQSLFFLQSDQCSVAGVCGPNATCTNTATSHTCTCNRGYEGDGQTCVQVDPCLIDNGGCAQRCTTTSGGATCECYPGFGGPGCAPMPTTVKLLNEGFMQFVDVSDLDRMELMGGAGADVKVEAAGPGHYTFTVTYGAEYRLCAHDYSGFRATTLKRASGQPAPTGWDGPECQWSLVPVGGDRVRLKNAWLQQTHPYADFLRPRQSFEWVFTYDESVEGNTVFRIDADECALGTDLCAADATCTNTAGGYDCTCRPGYSGDGRSCVPDGPCVVDNGGCAQTCTEVAGNAVCSCHPGFQLGADSAACESVGAVVLYDVGLGRSLNILAAGDAPYSFEFTSTGRGIRMEPATDGRHDTFTFTFDVLPGTCADGSTSPSCVDQYRLCAGDESGHRWIETWHHEGQPLPATWNGPECTWIVERGANDEVHLRNLWMWQHRSYVDYLNCRNPYDCGFTSDDSTPPTATFRLLTDVCTSASHLCEVPRTCLNSGTGGGYVCSACPDGYSTVGDYACSDRDECAYETCGANAHCENRPGSFACVCDEPYVGDGTSCVLPGECATNNGGCAQLCAADSSGSAVCSCFPGFTANGSACVPVGDLNLGNVGLELWFAMNTSFAPPYRFTFDAAPAKVRMEQVAGTHDTFTFTAQHPCGTNCTDSYRLCAVNESGFRLGRVYRAQGAAAPTDWNDPKCQWQVRRAGGDRIRLRNAWLQTSFPYTEYLTCPRADASCVFNYDATGDGNTVFRVSRDGTDLCANVVCAAKDQCHAPGVCYPLSGLCSDPVLPVGTACDDGNRANTGDTCSSGVCVGGGDRDGDGVANPVDLCVGDDAAGDTDGDGRCDDSDTCLSVSNPSQLDTDEDGIGDACDNCPTTTATNQEDADGDGLGNMCDPDYRPLYPADPGSVVNGGNPSRPACGFTPVCPGASGQTRFNSYLFGCYADEPNGGQTCLGDRWWKHLRTRIYPAVLTTTSPGTVDGVLNELAEQQNNMPATTSCVNDVDCVAPATCEGNVCTMPAVKDFIDRLSASSNFLSCTGPDSYENTWPADRVIPLNTGGCDPVAEYHHIYGYRVTNTTQTPMTIWVTKARGEEGRWWTINPGEEIRFNAFGGALLFATTAEAYRVCSPGFVTKTVNTYDLVEHIGGVQGWGTIRVPQTNPVELVRYTVAASSGGGSLTITRDRELTLDLHLYVYPNYFGVGTPPFPQYGTNDLANLIITLARNVNGFTPVQEGGLRMISPQRYPVIDCSP